ncbi:MAG: transposase [Bryobacteraceae bacterium]
MFRSLPGAGAALVAAFGTDRERFASADEAARVTGIAPVRERSGAAKASGPTSALRAPSSSGKHA